MSDSLAMLGKYLDVVKTIDPIKHTGQVTAVKGLLIESSGPQAQVGEVCYIEVNGGGDKGGTDVWAEVVGLHGSTVQLMPYSEVHGIELGCRVVATGNPLQVAVSDKLLGRVLDSMGKPVDDKGDIVATNFYPAMASPPDVLRRKPIDETIITGIRAIDGIMTMGKGQRMGIFAGSGVGKSTLLGMIARNTEADVNVIALIGERGREVQEFIANDLGEEGLKKSVIIVSTSNSPALARKNGAYVAMAVAEYFRDQGKNVMLLFDSVTRFAMAQREIGLAIGEPPATRGYPPSMFSLLPRLLERCGTGEKGTITGFYTILVEGDDMDEPIADTVRGILDGHMVLNRRLAEKYHYPAIDVLASLSRLANKITPRKWQQAAGTLRKHLAVYTEAEDLINVGAYVPGSNPQIDAAIEKIEAIRTFLQQEVDDKAELESTLQTLLELSGVE